MSRFVFLSIIILLLPINAKAVSAYAVADDNFEYPDHIVQIDLDTGDFESFGRIADPYIGIEGMAISANDVIYGADDNTKTLVQIDLSNARALPVANVEQNFGFGQVHDNHDYGMTFACDGRLFLAVKHDQGLYQVNPETGLADLIGHTGHNFTSLASWDNRLFGVASGDFNLYEINTDTAEAHLVGELGNLGGDVELYGSGMSFDSEGQLWMIINLRLSDPLNPYPSRIFKVDIETGEATYVSDTLVGVESLAIANGQGCLRGTPQAEAVPALGITGAGFLIFLFSLFAVSGLRRSL